MIRKLIKILPLVATLSHLLSGCSACTEQYDSAPFKKLLKSEQAVANNPPPSLTEAGELPPTGKVLSDPAERYATLCASCHGAKGGGDGPGAMALNPKPRNLLDVAWQSSTPDDKIYKVIKSGGASIGLSATMAPWGAVLSDEEITAMVGYIRGLIKN